MYSKWADAFSQFQGFAEVTLKAAREKKDEEKEKQLGRDVAGDGRCGVSIVSLLSLLYTRMVAEYWTWLVPFLTCH